MTFVIKKSHEGFPVGRDESFEERDLAEARFEELLEGASLVIDTVNLVEEGPHGKQVILASGGYQDDGTIILLGERDELSHPEIAARIKKPERTSYVVTIGQDSWKLSRAEADSLFTQLADQGIGGKDGNKDEIKP